MAENKPILFFDGHCNLCNGFVDLLVRLDKQQRLFLAPLQGQTASHQLPKDRVKNLSSVVLRPPNGDLFEKSAAVFKVAWLIGGPLTLLIPFQILPRFLTDWIYDRVANHRYSLFGRRDTCRLPTEAEKQHFLD